MSGLADFIQYRVDSSEEIHQLIAYLGSVLEHLLLACLTYVTLCVCVYLVAGQVGQVVLCRPLPRVRRALVVVAHPDDECMFFGPTLLNLVRRHAALTYILCLSTGNHDGLGRARKAEMLRACDRLGVSSERVVIINSEFMPDDPKACWRADYVGEAVLKMVEQFGIDTVITFDKCGISGHLNHCCCYYAAAYLLLTNKLPQYCRIYLLKSISVLFKYSLLFDLPLSLVCSKYRYVLNDEEKLTLKTALRQHHSQMVWFRKLYLIFSRYMTINTLRDLQMIDVELDLQPIPADFLGKSLP